VIDNPELVAELRQAEADKAAADAELARINVGTRSKVVAQRKVAIGRATTDLTLAQQTYNRTKQLAAAKFAPLSKLDQDTDALTLAKSGSIRRTRPIRRRGEGLHRRGDCRGECRQGSGKERGDQGAWGSDDGRGSGRLAINQIPAEEGELVTPGVPLLPLMDLNDTRLGFSLRTDLIAGPKVGIPVHGQCGVAERRILMRSCPC
jgi:HlyD family secretion protein